MGVVSRVSDDSSHGLVRPAVSTSSSAATAGGVANSGVTLSGRKSNNQSNPTMVDIDLDEGSDDENQRQRQEKGQQQDKGQEKGQGVDERKNKTRRHLPVNPTASTASSSSSSSLLEDLLQLQADHDNNNVSDLPVTVLSSRKPYKSTQSNTKTVTNPSSSSSNLKTPIQSKQTLPLPVNPPLPLSNLPPPPTMVGMDKEKGREDVDMVNKTQDQGKHQDQGDADPFFIRSPSYEEV